MADKTIAELRAELLQTGGNVFMVSGLVGGGVQLVAPPLGPMDRKEVANLVAWLVMVGMLVDSDVAPILRQHGYISLSQRMARESGYSEGSNPPPPSDGKPDVE